MSNAQNALMQQAAQPSPVTRSQRVLTLMAELDVLRQLYEAMGQAKRHAQWSFDDALSDAGVPEGAHAPPDLIERADALAHASVQDGVAAIREQFQLMVGRLA